MATQEKVHVLMQRSQALKAHVAATAVSVPPRSPFDTEANKQPDKFDGQHNKWRDWSFQSLAFVAMQDPRLMELMVLERWSIDTRGSGEQRARSNTILYYLLTLFLGIKGVAFRKRRNVTNDNGFKTWKRVVEENGPRNRRRRRAILRFTPDCNVNVHHKRRVTGNYRVVGTKLGEARRPSHKSNSSQHVS